MRTLHKAGERSMGAALYDAGCGGPAHDGLTRQLASCLSATRRCSGGVREEYAGSPLLYRPAMYMSSTMFASFATMGAMRRFMVLVTVMLLMAAMLVLTMSPA